MFFDDKSFGLKPLNGSSSLLHDGPFDVVSHNSPIPFFNISTRQWDFVLVSTRRSTFFLDLTGQPISILIGPPSPLTGNFPFHDRPSAIVIDSPFPYLPKWATKTIEATSIDVRDVSSS
jgi:hypothetical protein